MPKETVAHGNVDDFQITRQAKDTDGSRPQKNHRVSRLKKEPFEVIPLRLGLEMTICNQSHQEGMKVDFEIEKAPVSLSYNLLSPIRCTMVHEGRRKTVLERRAGDGLLAFLPKTKGITEAPSGPLIGLSIYMAPSMFLELVTKLPDALTGLYPTHSGAPTSKPLNLKSQTNWETRFIIKQIIQCPFQGDARKLFLEAKALELIANKLGELGYRDPEQIPDLSPRDLENAREAYHILLKRIECPPSLHDLSSMVGMNRNKLNRGFRQLYGGTVFKVLHDARLYKAWSLLKDTDSTLSEIALSVGYSDQANFSNAFRRHFGQTPNIVRKKGLPRPEAR